MFLESWRNFIRGLKGQNRQKPIRRTLLRAEVLEDRTNPAPISPTGVLGALAPTATVVFNTTTG